MNASLLNLMSCIDLYLIEKVYPAKFFSIHCLNTSGSKLNSQSNVFDDVRNKFVCAYCIVTLNERKPQTMFPVNTPRSYGPGALSS